MTKLIRSVEHRSAARWPLFGLTLATLIAGPALAGTAASAGSGGSAGVTAPALPTGGSVQAGSASIGAPSGSSLTVTQTSSRAIINWTGFSIGSGGSVQFNNGSGATLNRVTGSSVSAIDGLLSGTGSVYLINPNGVIVGKDGVINTGGTFAASTLDLTNSNFMAGGDLTFSGASTASVVNEGKIGSLGGDVALIAAKVENDGTIAAAQGDVGLAAGYAVVLRDSLLDEGKFAVVVGGSDTSVTNTGAITAAEAELRANGGNVYALAGNTSSVIKATGVSTNDGKVFLVAEGAGATTAHGEIDATGQVETSGATVDFTGVTVKAATWLIDPDDLTIGSGDVGAIDSALNAGTDVDLQTTATTANTLPGSYGSVAAGSGDITIAAPISWSSLTGSALTLDSYHSIHIDAAISTNGGQVALITNDGSSGGGYDFGLSASGFAGSISFTGGAGSTDAVSINGESFTLLYSMTDLQGMNKHDGSLDGHYALASSQDASAYSGWVPVGSDGTGGEDNGGKGFDGDFTGLGNTITGLNVNITNNFFSGLFGLTVGSTLRDIGLVGGSTIGGGDVGALAGYAQSTITDVFATGAVTGNGINWRIGGLVGLSQSTITNAYATGAVTGAGGKQVGGLVGWDDGGVITNAYATGAVSATGAPSVGGLVGEDDNGTITSVHATGAVSGDTSVGGLIGGVIGSSVVLSYATGDVTGVGGSIGGLVGNDEDVAITHSYATGSVTGASGSQSVGGLVGYTFDSGEILQSFATGAVAGSGYVGGLVGGWSSSAGVGVVQSYSTGAVSLVGTANGPFGGLIAYNSGTALMENDYWSVQTSGQGGPGAGGNGVSTASMQGVLPLSFDASIWATGAGLFPYLKSFFPGGVQAISGFVYSDAGLTPIASSGAGAVTVTGIADGDRFGTATTGANGYYYIFGPAGSFTTGDNLLTYTSVNAATGATDAATLATATAALNQSGDSLYGAAVTAPTAITSLFFAPTLSSFKLSAIAADGFDPAATAAINGSTGQGIIATGAFFTADMTLSTSHTLVIQTAAGAPLIVQDILEVVGPGSLGLLSGGQLDIDTSVLSFTGGSVNLAYDASSPTNLSFGLTGGGFQGSVTFATLGAGALDINGTPYSLIFNTTELQAINSGLGGHYALANSLDATGVAGWIPIGTNGTGTVLGGFTGFTGVFTGLGHTVSNLSLGTGANSYAGLFGYVNGSVRDIGLVNVALTSTGGAAIGTLSGYAGGVITDDYATGSLSSSSGSFVGGLVGETNGGLVTDAFAVVTVTGSLDLDVGGLVGSSSFGTVSDAYATGAVTIGGASQAIAGLVGYAYSNTITDAYATGAVTAGGSSDVGGLVGLYVSGSMDGTYATGAVSGASSVGGLVGGNGASVSNAYWDTKTSGQGASAGGTGEMTVDLQGALPSGFDSTVWSTGQGLYPFLTNFFPNGVQAVSGIAYSDAGLTSAASGAAGAVSVTAIGDGSVLGSATTGANGYYYVFGPSGTFAGGKSLLVFDSLNGATIDQTTLAHPNQGAENIYGDAITVPTNAISLSTAPTLTAAKAAATAADGGDAVAAAAIASAGGQGFFATGDFAIDQTVTTSDTFVVLTTGAAVLAVDKGVTVTGSGSLGLLSSDILDIDAAISVTGAGSANLSYDPISPTNLSFDLTGAGFLGSLTFASGFSQKLDINGAPYTLIYDTKGLQGINGSDTALQGNYALAGSLDATSVSSWTSIGTDGAGTILNSNNGFSGAFTGLGHTISNLAVSGTGNDTGPFGWSSGVIRDIGIVGGSVTATSNVQSVGGLVAVSDGVVADAYATDSVTGGEVLVGGLIGQAFGSGGVFTVFATGAVSAPASDVGGLIGAIGIIPVSDAYATGAVTGLTTVGGLVGGSNGSITNAYATGAVNASSDIAGGLVGLNEAAITNAYATGDVQAGGTPTGGLVGWNLSGTITNGYYDYQTTGEPLGLQADGSLGTEPFGPTLPSGFDGSVWTTGLGLYPYLTNFFPNGVEAITGTAYSSLGVKAVAAQIGVYSKGGLVGLGTASSGANGVFYEIVPAGTLAEPFLHEVEVGETITLAGSSTVSGLRFTDNQSAFGSVGAEVVGQGGSTANAVTSGLELEQTDNAGDSMGLLSELRATFGTAAFNALDTTLDPALLDIQGHSVLIDLDISRTGPVEIESSGDLMIDANISSTATGDAVILAANGDFIEDNIHETITTANGRWLIFSQQTSSKGLPPSGDDFGALTAENWFGDQFNSGDGPTNFIFSTSEPGTFVNEPGPGNRFVYGYQPTLTVTPDTKSVPYNGSPQTDTFTAVGLVAGDSQANALQGTPGGLTTSSKQVGAYTLTATLGTLASGENYKIGLGTGVLTITPLALTVSFIGAVQKVYDGTTAANLTSANYVINGLLPADAGAAVLSGGLLGTYATKNQGTGILVTVNNISLVLSGPDAGDYTVNEPNETQKGNQITFSLSAASGTITPIILTDSLQGTVRKTYDGNNTATLTSANYKLTGKIVAGDNVALNNPTSGTYNDQNAATGKTVSVTGLVLNNNPFGDYQLSNTSLSAAIGIIDPKVLTASLIGVVSKVYDGTTNATLTAANYSLTGGIIAGDVVSLNNPTTGTYATTGQKGGTGILVTVRGLALSGAAAHNYVLSATTISANIGTITAH